MNTLRTHLHMFAIVAALVTMSTIEATSAQAGQGNSPPKAVAIAIDNFKFGVASLEVAAGTTVTWTNHDDVPHTVASTTKTFKSPPLDTGEAFSYTFKEAGTFEYYCSMHPRMIGKIVVTASTRRNSNTVAARQTRASGRQP
jgi:plastocyanin